MKNSIEEIVFTPIEELFSEKELLDMFLAIKPRLHCCYIHSCLFAMNMAKKDPSIEYHEGVYSHGLFVHAWNSIVKEGKRFYFDFTGYFLEKKHMIKRGKYAIVLRTYSPKEIFKLMFKKGILCCQIEDDGTYQRFIDKNFKKEKEEVDKLIAISKKAKEHVQTQEILSPCISY